MFILDFPYDNGILLATCVIVIAALTVHIKSNMGADSSTDNIAQNMTPISEEIEDVVIIRPEAIDNIPEISNDPGNWVSRYLELCNQYIDNLNILKNIILGGETIVILWLSYGLFTALIDSIYYIFNKKDLGYFYKWAKVTHDYVLYPLRSALGYIINFLIKHS
jgi:hypothetical protein